MDDDPTYSDAIDDGAPSWQRRAPSVVVTAPPPAINPPRVAPCAPLTARVPSTSERSR